MSGLLIAANGSASAATQSKYQTLGVVSYLVRLRVDELMALADSGSTVYHTIIAMTGKSNLRLAVTRNNTDLYFVIGDTGEGYTGIITVARSALPATGSFVNMYGYRRDSAGAGGGITSAVSVYSGATVLGSTTSSLVFGALPTGAGAGALAIGGAAAFAIAYAYIVNRALTPTEIQTEPTLALSGLVGGYPMTEGSGTTTADMVSGGTALTLSGATWIAGGATSARVSAASGNWASAATWVGGTIPSSTDTVTISDGHTVTIAASTSVTVGDSANPTTYAIRTAGTGGTGILVVGTGATLIVQGNVLQGNAIWTINASATLRSSHATANLKWTIGDANATTARLVFAGGTGSARITVNNALAGRWYGFGQFDVAFADSGKIYATGVQFTGVGLAASNAFQFVATTASSFLWYADDCLFTDCSSIGSESYVHPTASFRFLRSSYRTPTATGKTAFKILVNAPATTGTRIFDTAVWEGALDCSTGAGLANGLTLTDCLGRLTSGNAIRVAGVPTSWQNVLFDTDYAANGFPCQFPGEGTLNSTVMIRRGASGNPHWAECNVTGNLTMNDFIAWTPDVIADGGDAFQLHGSPVGVSTVSLRNWINLPSGSGLFGDASGSMLSAVTVGNNNVKVNIEHCTSFCGNGPILSENFSPVAGYLVSARSNLFWRRSARAGTTPIFIHAGTGTPAAGSLTGVNFNARYNCDTTTYGGAFSAASFAAPSTPTNDVVGVNPAFVDDNRNPLTWAQSLDGAITTTTQALDKLFARNDDTGYDTRFSISAMITWIKAGFVPTAVSLQAAHDGVNGGWMGAMTGNVGGASRFGAVRILHMMV